MSYGNGLGCLSFKEVSLNPSDTQRETYGIIRCWYFPSGLISLPFASFLGRISRPQMNNANKINIDSSAKSGAGQRLHKGISWGVVFVSLKGSSPSTMSKSAIFLWVGAALGTQEPFWFEVPRVRIQLGIMQYCTMKNPINARPHLRKAKERAH